MDFRVSVGFFTHPEYFKNIRENCGMKEKKWTNNDVNDVSLEDLDYFFKYPIFIDYARG